MLVMGRAGENRRQGRKGKLMSEPKLPIALPGWWCP
jgi:hypothetical protein